MSDQRGLSEFAKEEAEVAGWKKKQLGEIFQNIYSGGTPKKGVDEYYNGDLPFVKIEDLNRQQWGGVSTAEEYITDRAIKETSARAFEPGALLLTIYGVLAETAIVKERVATNQAILGMWDANEDNTLFVKYGIDADQKYLESLSRQTTQANLGKEIVQKHRISVPPLEEQRKIASILYSVDEAIQRTENIIQQTSTVKSGVVQHVFREGVDGHESYIDTKSGKTPECWELVRFEEVIEDTRYGTNNKSNTDGDGYPTLRIPNIVKERVTLDDLKHTPLEKDELNRLKLKENDILVIRTNGNPNYVGRCATFSEQNQPFVFASYLIRVRVDESRVRPVFIREFLNSPRGRSQMAGWIRSSAGNYNLSVGAMEKFQIPIPPLDEQDMIVEKIHAAEQTIEINREYLKRQKMLKQGLMQDLLSGKVRTTDTTIEVLPEVAAHG